jgi:hypothetical protein
MRFKERRRRIEMLLGVNINFWQQDTYVGSGRVLVYPRAFIERYH